MYYLNVHPNFTSARSRPTILKKSRSTLSDVTVLGILQAVMTQSNGHFLINVTLFSDSFWKRRLSEDILEGNLGRFSWYAWTYNMSKTFEATRFLVLKFISTYSKTLIKFFDNFKFNLKSRLIIGCQKTLWLLI